MADYIPDLPTFRKLALENLSNKLRVKLDNSEEAFTIALALSAAIKKVFYEKSEQKFSSEPIIDKRRIIQFVHRMRIDAMEKFQKTTFLSVVHFYLNELALKENQPVGLIVVYIERTYVPEMLRLFKYPYIDYEDDDEVLDGIGAITNLIAGSFKKEIARLGYVDLEMSHFQSAINTVLDGVEYCKTETEKFEITFEIDDKKRMVVELSLAPIPRKLTEDEE